MDKSTSSRCARLFCALLACGTAAYAAESYPTRPIRMIVAYPPGGGPALVDMLAGQIQLYFATMPAAMPHVKSGKLRPIAVTSSQRSQALPELPTVAESGVSGYEAATWYGLLAPAGTSQAIVSKLHEEVVKILASDARQRLAAQGLEPVGNSPADFGAYIKSEIVKWGKVIRDAGIRAE